MDEKYLTVKEVADHLQVSRQAVYNWINEGRLKAVRVGTHVRITGAALREFIQPVVPGEHIEEDSAPGPLVAALALG